MAKNENVGFTKDRRSSGPKDVGRSSPQVAPDPWAEGTQTGSIYPGDTEAQRSLVGELWSCDARVLRTGGPTGDGDWCSPRKLRLRVRAVAQARAPLNTRILSHRCPDHTPGSECASMGELLGARGRFGLFVHNSHRADLFSI